MNCTEVEGFYNLMFAHIFNLYPASSPEARQYVTALLKVISTSTSDRLSVKYRMYVFCIAPNFPRAIVLKRATSSRHAVCPIYSTASPGHPHYVSLSTKRFSKSRPRRITSRSWDLPSPTSRSGCQSGISAPKRSLHSSSRLSMPTTRLNNRESVHLMDVK